MVSEPKKLVALFKKSISALNRRTAFISYGESYAYRGGALKQLANDIMKQVMPISADLAVDLLEKLLVIKELLKTSLLRIHLKQRLSFSV